MQRRNLVEVEDLPQLPALLRDAITGYLRVATALSRPYAATAPVLAELVRESGQNRVVDLASGGGGPWPQLLPELTKQLGRSPEVILSDTQPNEAAVAELERLPGVTYRREPVSALQVPRDLLGRTAQRSSVRSSGTSRSPAIRGAWRSCRFHARRFL